MSGNKGKNGGEKARFQKHFHTQPDGYGQLKISCSILDVLLKSGHGSL